MNNCKVTSTIATLKRKFLDGWILSVGFSGKDSFVTLHSKQDNKVATEVEGKLRARKLNQVCHRQ